MLTGSGHLQKAKIQSRLLLKFSTLKTDLFQIKVLEIRNSLFKSAWGSLVRMFSLSLKKWLFSEKSRTEQSHASIFEKLCIFPANSGSNVDYKHIKTLLYQKSLFLDSWSWRPIWKLYQNKCPISWLINTAFLKH